MAGPEDDKPITVALLGNPNTGKSTLFNALCGVRQRVGNFPGVTVEKHTGFVEIGGRTFEVVDLPGTYSLAPRSPDEMVAVDLLLGCGGEAPPPDVILCIADASNLDRNLYLVSQVLELGRPVVVALNKTDLAAEHGLTLDVDLLRERLGVALVATQAHRLVGLAELRQALLNAVGGEPPRVTSPFPEVFCREVTALVQESGQGRPAPLPRYLAERLLLDVGGYLEQAQPPIADPGLLASVRTARQRLAEAGYPAPAVEAMSRYDWVASVLDGAAQHAHQRPTTVSDRLDTVLTHKLWGVLIFGLLMAVVFQAIFAWAAPLMDWLDRSFGRLGDSIVAAMPEGVLRSLIVDGVIAGVGGVLVFLPQILILFAFISLLEECGYMARAAYLMDRVMVRIGLSGKSFIPLLSSFACAVPGIMATRAIENRRDRLLTILIAPLMGCSARLQVYSLLIAAFIPDRRYLGGWVRLQGVTLLALYLIGILAAVAVAWVLRRTLLRGQTPSFVMELPTYQLPSVRNVVSRVWDAGWSFLRQAGTLIVAVAIVVWAAAYFPRDPQVEQDVRSRYAAPLRQFDVGPDAAVEAESQPVGRNKSAQFRRVGPDAAVEAESQEGAEIAGNDAPSRLQERAALEQRIDNEIAAAYIEHSYLGRAGKRIAPLVRPLGWDWRIGCAVIASFPAREVVIGTLGVIYQLGSDHDAASASLRETLRTATWPDSQQRVFNVPVALSIMVFFALCAQCAATLAVMRRETDSWGWPAFTFVYMTGLAYVGALVTYQAGMWLAG
jgi:ferrous iron transport protein B